MVGRKNLGRQKTKMEKIQNPNYLNATFSKRRAGLFKKAYELSVMCGVEVGLICFSPAGKPFSYANSDLVHVMNHFENGGGAVIPNDQLNIDLNSQFAQIERELEAERMIGEEHDKRGKSDLSRSWCSEENLKKFAEDEENLKRRLVKKATMLQATEVVSSTNLPLDFFGNYLNHGGADIFNVGTSTTTSSSGSYRGRKYGFGPRGPL